MWLCGQRLGDFIQPLLKLAAIFCTGNHTGKVELYNLLILQRRGHITSYDALREALYNGGFTHTRLANEYRVILRPAA